MPDTEHSLKDTDNDDYVKLFLGLEKNYLFAIGENWNVAYGKGKYKFSKEQPNDTFSKDLLMIVLRPLTHIFVGSVSLAIDLIRVVLNILSALVGNQNKLGVSLASVALDIATILLGIASPILRTANLISRSYATLREPAEEQTFSMKLK